MSKYPWIFLLFILAIISCKEREKMNEYYSNDGIKTVWYFKNDTSNGVKEVYWKNGNVSQRYNYLRGRKNGEYLLFFKNGWIAEKGTFTNDLRHRKVYNYYASDSAKLKREAYIVLEGDKGFYYYIRDFNRAGTMVEEQRQLEFQRTNRNGQIAFNYVGEETFDSMKIVVGSYDYRFSENRTLLQDTFKFHDRTVSIPSQNRMLTNEFLRGKFLGFKGHERGDTIFTSIEIRYFEEKLKEEQP